MNGSSKSTRDVSNLGLSLSKNKKHEVKGTKESIIIQTDAGELILEPQLKVTDQMAVAS